MTTHSTAADPPRFVRAAAAARHVAGRVAEMAGRATRTLPGLAGAGAVSYGAWLAWAPLGFIVAGAFLLALDRRVP